MPAAHSDDLRKRVIGKVPWGHWETTTFTAGLRCDGLTAPWVLDGAMNKLAFETYVEKVLAPTLKPIEMAFAKLKALLRKAAERTVGALWDRIGQVLDAVTPDECANHFRHAGYGST